MNVHTSTLSPYWAPTHLQIHFSFVPYSFYFITTTTQLFHTHSNPLAFPSYQKPNMSQTGGAPPPWTSHTHIDHIIPNNNTTTTTSSKKNNTSRRRFQDQQIRCLETIFQEEARPELRLKQQLANQLGLQSRQVAIWFQNKRARSKTKQLEQQYNILKASYDDLTSKFEALKKENHSLHIQVQRLGQLSAEYGLKDSIKLQTDEMPKFQMLRKTPATTQNYGEKTDYLQQQSPALHATDACLTLPEESCNFQTDDHLEYQSCNSQLWEW